MTQEQEDKQGLDEAAAVKADKLVSAEELAAGEAVLTLLKPLLVDKKEFTEIIVKQPLARHRMQAIRKAGEQNLTIQFYEIALMVCSLKDANKYIPLTSDIYDRLQYMDALRLEKKLLGLAGF